jgi:SAM-dependent methyltransferase
MELVSRVQAAYDGIAAEYARVNAEMAPQLVGWIQELIHVVRNLDLILDIGCGHGRDMAWFDAQGMMVTGVDTKDSEEYPSMTGTMNTISISVAPTTGVIGKRYYDLPGTIELMHRLWQESALDGFEFQNLAEWEAAGPPRDEATRRLAAWEDSQRHTTNELASLLRATGLPIQSVHANRDVGICLCSGDKQDMIWGKRLIHESLSLAETVGAPVCVFHLWDTWREEFDLAILHRVLCEAATHHPGVKASVENVPTQLARSTPFDLVQQFEWITLDLQWAAMYDELDRFESVMDRIVNVHLRGRLEGKTWLLDDASFGFYEALRILRREWGYCGLLTMEPNGLRDGDLERFVAAMASLRGNQ